MLPNIFQNPELNKGGASSALRGGAIRLERFQGPVSTELKGLFFARVWHVINKRRRGPGLELPAAAGIRFGIDKKGIAQFAPFAPRAIHMDTRQKRIGHPIRYSEFNMGKRGPFFHKSNNLRKGGFTIQDHVPVKL